MAEPFRKDRKLWDSSEQDQVEYFLKCNEFFAPIFEIRHFEEILDMSFYCRVNPQQPLYLKDNKRPVAIILLSGHLGISKRNTEAKHGKKKEKGSQQFVKTKQLHSSNQTFQISSDCKISCLHGVISECLFVPASLFNKFMYKRKQQKDDIMFNMLNKIFHVTERRPVLELAQAGCKIRDLRFNSYVYHQGDTPESVFIILEGSAKVEEPGFSYKSANMVVVSTNSIVGDKDLNLPQRQTSVVCCSSIIRLLQIPKEPFLKFARSYLPNFQEPLGNSKMKKMTKMTMMSKKRMSLQESEMKLPSIFRIKSSVRSQEEEEREYKLIKNSHILLDASSPRMKDKIRVRSSVSDYPKDMMKEKIKFYKKIRPNEKEISLTNRII